METRTIYITDFDFRRITELLKGAKYFKYQDRDDLKKLGQELERATIVNSKDIPPDIVTMNCEVELLDLDRNEKMTFTLVFPNAANIDQGKISILAPIGTAILGYRVGDTLIWQVPAGQRRIKILKILYQPEASGDYHL
jgi:regulator of nucleoside diphosphate kinase